MKWFPTVRESFSLLGCAYLSVSLYLSGDHYAAGGWGVAAIYAFSSMMQSIAEVL